MAAYSYPALPAPVTRAHFKRLLWRAGFGGRKGQIDHYQALGLSGAIEELLTPFTVGVMPGTAPTDNGAPIDPLNHWGHDCLWWLDRMVRSRNQLVERMTLDLHDHFATSNAGVGNTRHMLRQNRLLRRYALGSFGRLLTEITYDPAMLLWLNGADNNRWAPNENYAREVMELFCLGNDPELESLTFGMWRASRMYTQTDVHEAARALTGWRYDWNRAQNGTIAQRENPAWYDPGYHDTGTKTIFGQTGRWGWQGVVDLVLHHPNHAPYLAYKLWTYFNATPPTRTAMTMMVRNYRQSGFELRPLLRVILRHPSLYANLAAPDMVKPPIVFVAGGLRATGRHITTNAWSWILDGMGQVPFYPPNVSGWKQGPAFLNTNTARAYWTAADYLLTGTVADPGPQTPAAAFGTAAVATAQPWISPHTRAALMTYSETLAASHQNPSTGQLDTHNRQERQKVLRTLMMAGPDGLVH
ncbi:MAG: DUF1800 domain-containing protein [Gaiellales bacterium]